MWLVMPVLALALGIARAPWWTAFIAPVGTIALAVVAVAREPDAYDMAGFAYYVGAAVGAVCVALWLIGRAIGERRPER